MISCWVRVLMDNKFSFSKSNLTTSFLKRITLSNEGMTWMQFISSDVDSEWRPIPMWEKINYAIVIIMIKVPWTSCKAILTFKSRSISDRFRDRSDPIPLGNTNAHFSEGELLSSSIMHPTA